MQQGGARAKPDDTSCKTSSAYAASRMASTAGRTTEVKQATAVGGDMLIVAGAGAKEVAEFVVAPTEALGGGEAPEAAHASDAAFDAPVVLFKAVEEDRTRP